MPSETGGAADDRSEATVIPGACKRLAEVDFPIAAVWKHAARETSIRHGHPSTLHLWWARRPLASSRAVPLALLLPDPCDPRCPEAFRRAAARRLRELAEHLVETRAGSALPIADLKADLRSRKPGVKQAVEREAGGRAQARRDLSADASDWAPTRVRAALLQGEGIRGADLVFACLGPALELFSRHRAVETADGRAVGLAEYVEKVWEVVGRTALESVLDAAEAKARNGLAGALEEGAGLTALFLWTLQATAGDATGETAAHDADSPAGDATAGEHADDAEDATAGRAAGFSLVFDVVRRFAQPLGIDLDKWEKRTIETKKGVVRLLPVAERATQLFGKQGAHAVAAWLEQEARAGADPLQGVLFPDPPRTAALTVRERRPRFGESGDGGVSGRDRSTDFPATTLDRVHTGMLLQPGGRTNALRALVQAERDRGTVFLRPANALSALYPRGSHEKRLLDAMLLAAPR